MHISIFIYLNSHMIVEIHVFYIYIYIHRNFFLYFSQGLHICIYALDFLNITIYLSVYSLF